MEQKKTPIYKSPVFWAAAAGALCGIALFVFLITQGGVTSTTSKERLYGNYVFEKQVYMCPLSSFLALDGFEEYYTLGEDTLTITSASGEQRIIDIGYEFTEADESAFKDSFMLKTSGLDISQYKERYVYTLCEPQEHSSGYELYIMDGELWLARVGSGKLGDRYFWSIYSIKRYGGELPKPAPAPSPSSSAFTLRETEITTFAGDVQLRLELGGMYVRQIGISDETQKRRRSYKAALGPFMCDKVLH